MPGRADRILTTHVGSLVRPPKLVEFLHKIEDKEQYDRAAYEACLAESIDEVVRRQAEVGIDIVSDGEFSKGRNWAFYVHDRLSGVATRALTPEEAKDPLASAGGGQDRVACSPAFESAAARPFAQLKLLDRFRHSRQFCRR